MSLFNRQPPAHPVASFAFWNTKPDKIRAMADRYDALVGDDAVLKKQLDDLLTWAREEAISDEIYSQGEG